MEEIDLKIKYIEEIDIQTDIIDKVNNVYGLEGCKWKLINYNSYTKLKGKINIGNYNVWIKNKSRYNSAEKLVEIIWNILKSNGVIETGYKYIDTYGRKEEIEEDLLIIEIDSVWNLREKFRELFYYYPNKIFIVIERVSIDEEYRSEEIEEIIWRMEVEKISKKDKIDYIKKTLKEQGIKIEKRNILIEKLSNKPYSEIRSEMLNIIVKCKDENVNIIGNTEFEKENIENNKNRIKEKDNKNSIKELETLIGLEEVKEQINQIINYIKVGKTRGKMPMLHMCFLGNPGSGKTEVARIVRKDICRK